MIIPEGFDWGVGYIDAAQIDPEESLFAVTAVRSDSVLILEANYSERDYQQVCLLRRGASGFEIVDD